MAGFFHFLVAQFFQFLLYIRLLAAIVLSVTVAYY